MPELHEVETIKHQLNLLVAGKKIKRIEILLPKIVKTSLAEFKKATNGSKINGFNRRAKILIMHLDNGWSLLIHLKLSGQLIFDGQKSKHTHVIFHFTNGHHLIFNDLRQFGYVKIIKTGELDKFFEKEDFGPEPFDKNFSLAQFVARLDRRPNTKIKQFLLDQTNIAGIGNIYSDEILFASRIHPLRKIKDLKPNEIKNIYKNIKKILNEAIRLKGTSSNLYVDAYGKKGSFLNHLKVYGREDEKCKKCAGLIKRIKLGGRSAHFCPTCQRLA